MALRLADIEKLYEIFGIRMEQKLKVALYLIK